MANQVDIIAGQILANQIKGNGSTLAFQRRAITMTDADITLSSSQYDGTILEMSGTLTAGRNVILPLTDGTAFIVNNLTGQTLTFKGATGTGVAVATAKVAIIYCNGTNYYRVGADVSP